MEKKPISPAADNKGAMRTRANYLMAATVAIAIALGLAAGCSDKRITKANVDEVTEGMSKKQVESILGPPTSIDSKDFVVTKTTTYVYRQGKDTVTIVFKDDKLLSKDSTLSQ
jgi:outer membrane protein assembly factor BamE (lipoprotein component of BamABCDE complex)